MRWVTIVVLVMPAAAAAGDCPDYESLGSTADVVETRLAEVEALYPQIYDEIDKLRELDPWVRDGVSCLTTPIEPTLAARYHRLRALGDDPLGGLSQSVRQGVSASLAAGLRLEPGHRSTLPDDHGHYAFGAEALAESTFVEVTPVVEGRLFFDGVAGVDRPSNTATFFQRADTGGVIVDSAYLLPADALPAYPVASVAVGTEPEPRGAKGRLRVAAAGVGAGSLALLAGNLITRNAALNGTGATAETAHQQQPLVNGLAISSWTLGVASAGLFTTSLVVK